MDTPRQIKQQNAETQHRKRERISNAIVSGLNHAKDVGYTKPYDVAISIKVALKEAGFNIVRKSK